MNAKCISFYYCFLSGFWGPGLHLLFQHHQMALDCSRLLLPLWLPVFYYTKESSTLYRHVFCIGLSLWLSGKITTCKARAAGEASLIPGSGRSSGGGHGNLIQYFCLENPMDRGAWQATVHSVAKSQTQPKQLSMLPHILCLGYFLPNQFSPSWYNLFIMPLLTNLTLWRRSPGRRLFPSLSFHNTMLSLAVYHSHWL